MIDTDLHARELIDLSDVPPRVRRGLRNGCLAVIVGFVALCAATLGHPPAPGQLQASLQPPAVAAGP